jgi:hypothetical protein
MSRVLAMEVKPPFDVTKATHGIWSRCAGLSVQRHGQSERINVMLNKSVFLLAATLAAAPMACALAAADTPGNAASPNTGYSSG